jgi:hypothetical protein
MLGGTAFAIAIAGPPEWCACPMHGAVLHAPAPQADLHAADMQMPASSLDAALAGAHSGHNVPDSNHAGHKCTCPGGCCGTTPAGLLAHTLSTSLALHVSSPARVAHPTDAIEIAASPQLALPFANAPPEFGVTLQNAAHYTT